MNKKLSIITISFNSQKTIRRTLESVACNISEEVEYIIIDGGSTDGTIEIIKEYEKLVTFFISEKDRGIADAFNKGVSLATGEYLMFLNSDDELVSGSLGRVIPLLENDYSLFFMKMYWTDKKGARKEIPDPCFDQITQFMSVYHPSSIVSSELFKSVGNFSEKFKVAMDYEWFLRVFKKEVSVKHSDVYLTIFNEGGISTIDKTALKGFYESLIAKWMHLGFSFRSLKFFLFQVRGLNYRVFNLLYDLLKTSLKPFRKIS